MTFNLAVAWVWILLGLLTGTVLGLFFHKEEWLGGYGSWRRRMLRLGHISFFGTGLLNLAFALTVPALGRQAPVMLPSMLFVIGALAMPSVCFLSAWRKPLRHLFFIPVASLIGAVLAVLLLIFKGLEVP
jgi:hypothetical protein